MMEYATGFVILSVGMHRFNYYNKLSVITFQQRFTSIEGPTGAGKTSVLDAITFALYGKSSRTEMRATFDKIVKPGGYAFVEFEKNGNHYLVKRGRNDDGSSFVDLVINGDSFHGNIKSINPEIIRIVGMDYDAFVASSIIRQSEMTLFSSLTPAKRLERLQHLFHLNLFERALDKAKDDKKRIENEIINLKGEIEGIARVMENEDTLRGAIKLNTAELIDMIGTRKTERTNLDAMEADLKKMENERHEMEIQKERRQQVESSMHEASDRIHRITIDSKDLAGRIQDAREQLPSRERIDLLETKTPVLRDLESTRGSIESAIAARNKTRAEQEKRYNDLREKYKGGISLDEYTDFAIAVGLSEGLVTDDAKTLRDELEDKKPQVVKGVVSTVLDKEIGAEKLDSELEDELSTANARIDDLVTLLGIATSKEGEDLIASMGNQIKSIEIMEKELDGKKEAIAEARETVRQKEEEIVRIDGKMDDLENKLVGDEELLNGVNEKRAEMEKISSEIAELKGVIKTSKKNLETIEKYKDVIDENKAKLDRLNEDLVLVNEIAENVLHKRGVTMYAIEMIMGVVELKASELLNYMSAGQLPPLRFESTKQGFEIYIGDDLAAWKSGGEQVQLNASIRFAIAQKMSEMTTIGAKMKTLFIDEGDLSKLDEEDARVRFMDMIFALDQYFEKIIMITHFPSITQNFDAHVRVEKVGDVSRIVD